MKNQNKQNDSEIEEEKNPEEWKHLQPSKGLHSFCTNKIKSS
jgi:hypothetical protein